MEFTSLDPKRGVVLEIGAMVTNDHFEEIPDSAVHMVLHVHEKHISPRSLNPWCQRNFSQPREEDNNKSLLDLVRESSITLRDAEAVLVRLVDAYRGNRIVNLAGSSVHTDLNFIKHHMPALASRLHYQVIDVSMLMNMTACAFDGVYSEFPRKTVTHCAMDDIRSSHHLYKWLLQRAMVPFFPLSMDGSGIRRKGPQVLVEDRKPIEIPPRSPALTTIPAGFSGFDVSDVERDDTYHQRSMHESNMAATYGMMASGIAFMRGVGPKPAWMQKMEGAMRHKPCDDTSRVHSDSEEADSHGQGPDPDPDPDLVEDNKEAAAEGYPTGDKSPVSCRRRRAIHHRRRDFEGTLFQRKKR